MPLKTRRRKYNHLIYKKISHGVRLNCIFDHIIHNKPIHLIVKETGFSYNTVRNIIVGYQESGRTNRKSFTRSSAHKPARTGHVTAHSSTAMLASFIRDLECKSSSGNAVFRSPTGSDRIG